MPRPYALGKRTEPKNETRARIVATSASRAIARFDAAPATVRNHFPDPRLLANAVFDELLAELRPPTPAIFEGVAGIRDRVTRLALELAAFYERSSSAWALYRQQPDIVEAWAGGVDRYYADIEALMRLSLGPLETDETALALVAAVIGPPTFFALRARGLSAEEAAELCVAVTVPWLETRAAANSR